MKGRSGRALSASFNAERPSNEGRLVIRENEVNSAVFKSGQELGARLDAGRFADEMIRFQDPLNELRVGGAILQQQNAEKRFLGLLAFGPFLGLVQRAPHRRHEPR